GLRICRRSRRCSSTAKTFLRPARGKRRSWVWRLPWPTRFSMPRVCDYVPYRSSRKDSTSMLRVEDMSPGDMHALLQRGSFGHLGCSRDGRPYVVPMHYAYDGKDLYFFTTEGTKTRFIHANPQVCLQVEEVSDSTHWKSVMVIGRATELDKSNE